MQTVPEGHAGEGFVDHDPETRAYRFDVGLGSGLLIHRVFPLLNLVVMRDTDDCCFD